MSSITSTLTGGLIGEAPDYAAMAKRSEAKRKGVIDLGMKQIGAVFEGGDAPFYTLAKSTQDKFDPKGTYFYQDKKGGFVPYWAPKGVKPDGTYNPNAIGQVLNTGGFDLAAMGVMKGLGLSKALGFGDEDSPREIAAKAFRRGQLFNSPTNQTFTGFDENFYKQREKAYLDYALPQVGDQFRQARDQLKYALSSRGLLNSSVEAKGQSDLNRSSGSARQAVGDEATRQVNETRRGVADAKQKAIDMLYQTADPAQAFQSAIRTSSEARLPSTFTPLANMFANLAQQYYQYRNPQGLANPQDDTGIASYLAKV